VLVYNFIRLVVRKGMMRRVPLLFWQDQPGRHQDHRPAGGRRPCRAASLPAAPIRRPPRVSVWMCYCNFLNRLSLQRIEEDYAGLF
jgi:hypothetical protein